MGKKQNKWIKKTKWNSESEEWSEVQVQKQKRHHHKQHQQQRKKQFLIVGRLLTPRRERSSPS